MFPGQIIQYIVTPILGIPTKWVTEITHVRDGEYFVDEQRFGPYALWHHKHFIKPIKNGVEMEDIIDYKIPMGFLGQIAHPIVVKPKLNPTLKDGSILNIDNVLSCVYCRLGGRLTGNKL